MEIENTYTIKLTEREAQLLKKVLGSLTGTEKQKVAGSDGDRLCTDIFENLPYDE